jgi:uncharacterized protein
VARSPHLDARAADPETLPLRAKRAILAVEPAADVILYGSRSRAEARPDSDWDLLVLVEGPVDTGRADAIRHSLYEVEWETGEVLCAVIRSRQDWESPLYRAMPFHDNVEREGIRL